MIVRNEAANLERSLGPVAEVFDDVVVMDTGSVDGTRELARSLGARVFLMDWPNDFSAARNTSIEKAEGDWIMWLDGDNYVSPENVEKIKQKLDFAKNAVLWCTEVVVPDGERLIQKRVFPKRDDVYFEGRVHEQLVHPDDFSFLMTDIEVFHWGYENKQSARSKGFRNLALLTEMIRGNPDDFYLYYQMGRTLFNLREFSRAEKRLKEALSLAKKSVGNMDLYYHAQILLVQSLDRAGKYDEADKLLKDLIERAPEYGPGHYFMGRRLYGRGDYSGCAESLARFLDLGVSDQTAGYNSEKMHFIAALLLGRSLHNSGRPEEAAGAYHLATLYDQANPEAPLALAKLAHEGGRREEALDYLTRCLAQSPGNMRARQMMEELSAHA